MTAAHLFLSHSSGDNTLALAVAQRLKARRHGVLLDLSGLQAGQTWRRELHLWLARCQAGLLLLTQAVLDKPDWVLKEAIVLGFRKDTEQDGFGFFWALGPGVTRQQFLDRGFSLAQLGDVQRLATPARLDAVDALVDELIAQLPPAPAETPFARLSRVVSDLLQAARQPGITCPKLAAHLGVPLPGAYGPDKVARLADGVAESILVSRDAGLQIHRLMQVLELWTGDDRRRLAELLAPHWVDPAAAAGLVAVAERLDDPARAAAVGIRGQRVQQYTAQVYLQRAYGQPVVLADAVEGDSPDLFNNIRTEICEYMRTAQYVKGRLSDDRVVQELRTWPEPVFVPLYGLPDDTTLQQLRKEFPRVVFIAGPAVDAEGAMLPLPASPLLQVLEPDPPGAVEQRESDDWRLASKFFR